MLEKRRVATYSSELECGVAKGACSALLYACFVHSSLADAPFNVHIAKGGLHFFVIVDPE